MEHPSEAARGERLELRQLLHVPSLLTENVNVCIVSKPVTSRAV